MLISSSPLCDALSGLLPATFQSEEALARRDERLAALGEVEANVAALEVFEEAGAWDSGETGLFGHPLAESGIVLRPELAYVHEDVVGALGTDIGKPRSIQVREKKLAFGAIERAEFLVVLIIEAKAVTVASCSGAAAPTVRKSWTFRTPSVTEAGAMT